MKWENLPTWLKGGIIGLILGLITFFILLALLLISGFCSFAGIEQCNTLFKKILFIFLSPAILLGIRNIGVYEHFASLMILLFFLTTCFIVGTLIGWIIGLMKKKN